MAHDIFISYSSKDKPVADMVCHILEESNIRCWIAPRDILAGQKWGTSIIGAINEARVVVLVLSTNSNQSRQVVNEIERAVNRGLPILPMRIEDVLPSPDLELFVSSSHWLDASTPPIEQHLQKLVATVSYLLGNAVPPRNDNKNSGGGPGTLGQERGDAGRPFKESISQDAKNSLSPSESRQLLLRQVYMVLTIGAMVLAYISGFVSQALSRQGLEPMVAVVAIAIPVVLYIIVKHLARNIVQRRHVIWDRVLFSQPSSKMPPGLQFILLALAPFAYIVILGFLVSLFHINDKSHRVAESTVYSVITLTAIFGGFIICRLNARYLIRPIASLRNLSERSSVITVTLAICHFVVQILIALVASLWAAIAVEDAYHPIE